MVKYSGIPGWPRALSKDLAAAYVGQFPSFRFCGTSPMAASRADPSAISAIGANGWPATIRSDHRRTFLGLRAQTDVEQAPVEGAHRRGRMKR